MPRRLLILVIAVIALKSNSWPQMHPESISGATFLIPGFYCGYMFGERGGFIAGVEVSVTHFVDDQSYFGVELNFSGWHYANKLHLGAEIGHTLLGLLWTHIRQGRQHLNCGM